MPKPKLVEISTVEIDIVDLFFFFFFQGLNLQHMEVPRLGIESELQLLAYTTATTTATWDLSRLCDLHHSSWQRQSLTQ